MVVRVPIQIERTCVKMKSPKKKIIRAATIPLSLKTFLEGSIEELKKKYDLVLLSSPNKELYELQDKYRVKTIVVSMERHISLTKDLKSLIRLICVFRKEKPYMVHSMTPKAGLLCMIAARVVRIPRRVHTFTGLIWPTATGLSRKILMFADWLTCACATHIIPEGEGVKRDLQQHITQKPMKVLGYGNVRGVNMEYWQLTCEVKELAQKLKAELWGQSNVFTFIFVGRLVSDKGINELVEAFLRLRDHYLDNNVSQEIRLLLVGPVEDNLNPLHKMSWERIKNTPSIFEVGPVWGKDILAYYAASDCFVFPSYREGFPNTVLEAGAMGLPSIVTDINGSREIIENGKNGLIIPSKNVDALYESMLSMVDDNEMRQEMKKNARTMIEERFEQRFVRKCLFDFYDEIGL